MISRIRTNNSTKDIMQNLNRHINCLLTTCIIAAFAIGACDDEPAPASTDDLVEVSDEHAVTPESLGFGDDWISVESGLWTHVDEVGEHKYIGIGEAGKLHAIASLLDVEEDLELRMTETPSDETREKLAELRLLIAEVQVSEERPLATDEIEFRCSFNVNAYVDAYPIACGAAATASASFSHPCGSTKGTVKTFAQASCAHLTNTQQCGPYSNNPASCSSTTSKTGAGPCSSYAYAQIYGVSGVNVYIWDNNGQRGACGTGTTTIVPPPDECPPPHQNCQPK